MSLVRKTSIWGGSTLITSPAGTPTISAIRSTIRCHLETISSGIGGLAAVLCSAYVRIPERSGFAPYSLRKSRVFRIARSG